MHILLTDQLTCPRCGPEFGLILLADQIADRRVRSGRLGCANCRASYPIREGVADLASEGQGLAAATELSADEERPTRTAALLGVTGPNASVLVVERDGAVASEMAELLPEVHLLSAVTRSMADPAEGRGGVVSRFRVGSRIPLRQGAVRGAAVLGVEAMALLPELARVVAPGGRIVVEPADESLAEACEKSGLAVLLQEAGVVVASTPGPG